VAGHADVPANTSDLWHSHEDVWEELTSRAAVEVSNLIRGHKIETTVAQIDYGDYYSFVSKDSAASYLHEKPLSTLVEKTSNLRAMTKT